MAKIIKLENIQPKDGIEQLVEEYVCGNCRHLVEPTDNTCWQCGEKLVSSSEVQHYHKGDKLSEQKFGELKREIS